MGVFFVEKLKKQAFKLILKVPKQDEDIVLFALYIIGQTALLIGPQN